MAEEYVIMPKSDYVSACDAIRRKTGKSNKIKSCDLCVEIDCIEGGGSGESGSIPFVSDTTFGNVTDVEVILPAVEGKKYYNGVLLPELPEAALAYTHCWIYRHETSGYYRLICSNVTWYVGGDPIGIRDSASVEDPRWNITDAELEAGEGWKELAAGNYYYTYEAGVKYPLWSMSNIMVGSESSNEVFLYGNEPITEKVKEILVPVEREYAYVVKSLSLNEFAAYCQKIIHTENLLSMNDMTEVLKTIEAKNQAERSQKIRCNVRICSVAF